MEEKRRRLQTRISVSGSVRQKIGLCRFAVTGPQLSTAFGQLSESCRGVSAARKVFSDQGHSVCVPRNARTEDSMLQQTLSIIKPDAVSRHLQGEILAMIQKSGLRIVAMKMIRLTRAQAEAFYEVHKDRPFYADLVEYMISGPVVCSVLEGEDAIASYRALMGATNPAAAAEGTIRRRYAESVQANAVHGSDAPETAAREVAFFFSRTEIVG